MLSATKTATIGCSKLDGYKARSKYKPGQNSRSEVCLPIPRIFTTMRVTLPFFVLSVVGVAAAAPESPQLFTVCALRSFLFAFKTYETHCGGEFTGEYRRAIRRGRSLRPSSSILRILHCRIETPPPSIRPVPLLSGGQRRRRIHFHLL